MKKVVAISLLFFYLTGFVQTSWVLIDFYLNRDDYTDKYCINLDQGITQCRASCYLDKVLEEKQRNEPDAFLVSLKQTKSAEICNCRSLYIEPDTDPNSEIYCTYIVRHYTFDFHKSVDHPPKIS